MSIFDRFKKDKKPEASVKSDEPKGPVEMADQLLGLNEKSIVSFHDLYLVEGFPLPGSNILSEESFVVTTAEENDYGWEYNIEGVENKALLEVEKDDGEFIILIQVRIDRDFPGVFNNFKKAWECGCSEFELNSVMYYLTENGECAEYDWWDYYSDPIDGVQKLFIGVEDYGDEGAPEYECWIGFSMPAKAIKEVIPAG